MPRPRQYPTGYMIDQTLPREWIDAAVHKADVPEADTFCDWLAGRLGDYRMVLQFRQDQPKRTEELASLTAMRSALQEVASAFTPSFYGASTRAWLIEMLDRHGVNFYQEGEAAREFAIMLGALIEQAVRQLRAVEAEGGRPGKAARDALFAAVFTRLGGNAPGIVKRRVLAADILRRCGIDLPDDNRKLRALLAKREQPED